MRQSIIQSKPTCRAELRSHSLTWIRTSGRCPFAVFAVALGCLLIVSQQGHAQNNAMALPPTPAAPALGSAPTGANPAATNPAAVSRGMQNPAATAVPGGAVGTPPAPSTAPVARNLPTQGGTNALLTSGPTSGGTAIQNTSPPATGNGAGQLTGGGKLPRGHNQEHRVYDLRPYTGYLPKYDRPEQAVVDWVLRETGTDIWFTAPFGFLNADRDKLSVYHTPEVHRMVGGIVNRFIAGDKDPQVLSLRVMTVGNPNWRSRAHLLMQHVNVNSPGVQAWLLSKENAAIVMNQLRLRGDARQVEAMDLVMHNGQSQKLAKTRGRNYVRNVKPAMTGWPPYEPETGEIQEGYRMEISPLLSTDNTVIDCVIKAEIDQVDKLKGVDLDLPLPNAQIHRARIDVPQVVSWRLHERFRWPSDMVLLLSCGVIASPERPQAAMPLLNLEMITGTTAGRADALMFLEFRGKATENLTTTPLVPQVATGIGAPNRGRY